MTTSWTYTDTAGRAIIRDGEDTEREALDVMTDRELVAYYNIMQFPGLVIGDKTQRHLPIVTDLLTERGILS